MDEQVEGVVWKVEPKIHTTLSEAWGVEHGSVGALVFLGLATFASGWRHHHLWEDQGTFAGLVR